MVLVRAEQGAVRADPLLVVYTDDLKLPLMSGTQLFLDNNGRWSFLVNLGEEGGSALPGRRVIGPAL